LQASSNSIFPTCNSEEAYRIYVDESIHDADGYIVSAFVFDGGGLDVAIERELRTHGLTPGKDEFKSRTPMRDNLTLQQLRSAIQFAIVQSGAPVALLISAASRRLHLGVEVVNAIQRVSDSNGAELSRATVFVDEGIRRPRMLPATPVFEFDQDSKIVLGLQAADLMASLGAYILREALHGPSKYVRPYDDDVDAELGWTFKMGLRRNFWRKHPEFTGDNLDEWFSADLLDYGVFLGEDVPNSVREAVEAVFSGIWLGCTR
jgi:hypothetical protein